MENPLMDIVRLATDRQVGYAIYSPSKGWFRGARWWRWTRFKKFSAFHDTPHLLQCLLDGKLRLENSPKFKFPHDAVLRKFYKD
jgi:hypothetical protein